MPIIESLRRRWRLLVPRLRREHPSARPLRAGVAAVLVLGVVGVLAFDAWLATCGFAGCPTPAEIRDFRPPEGGRLLDRNGRVIGRMQYIRRVNVPLDSVPDHVQQAFLATEDRRFHEHGGFDVRGFVRAVVRNVTALGVREGFSTITMQVARNTFIARHWALERTMSRKLMELRLAGLIENTLTKEQILELYLNVIYLGNGVYGVEAASRDLFGKGVPRLTVAEGAMLAGLPKAPSSYTPRRSVPRARGRRNVVIGLMEEQGFLTAARAERARKEPVRVAKKEWRPPQRDDSFALDAVRELVDSVMKADKHRVPEVVVYTTIDLPAQRAADRAVRTRAAVIERETGRRGGPRIEGAMVALDPRTGDIRAMVGGRHFERTAFNRAIEARRQPGSAFKPFVYATALSHGFTPATMVEDTPVEVRQGRQIWTPANYGGEYMGRVSLRRALMRSANAATVRVSRSVGEAEVVSLARRLGIGSPLQPLPALALGAQEVTPLELVAAYAPFANGGQRVRPRLVRRIETIHGRVLWEQQVQRDVVMDPRDAYQLTSMLRAAVDYGTGSAVRAYGIRTPVAGKTGTTNDGTDVWFVGYTPTIVAGFWFGYDQPRPIGGNANGGRYATPAWAEFYQQGWKERGTEADWAPPEGMVSRVIDAETGQVASEWCPRRVREWFKPGTEPMEECEEHYEPEWTWFGEVGGRLGDVFRRIVRF